MEYRETAPEVDPETVNWEMAELSRAFLAWRTAVPNAQTNRTSRLPPCFGPVRYEGSDEAPSAAPPSRRRSGHHLRGLWYAAT